MQAKPLLEKIIFMQLRQARPPASVWQLLVAAGPSKTKSRVQRLSQSHPQQQHQIHSSSFTNILTSKQIDYCCCTGGSSCRVRCCRQHLTCLHCQPHHALTCRRPDAANSSSRWDDHMIDHPQTSPSFPESPIPSHPHLMVIRMAHQQQVLSQLQQALAGQGHLLHQPVRGPRSSCHVPQHLRDITHTDRPQQRLGAIA